MMPQDVAAENPPSEPRDIVERVASSPRSPRSGAATGRWPGASALGGCADWRVRWLGGGFDSPLHLTEESLSVEGLGEEGFRACPQAQVAVPLGDTSREDDHGDAGRSGVSR